MRSDFLKARKTKSYHVLLDCTSIGLKFRFLFQTLVRRVSNHGSLNKVLGTLMQDRDDRKQTAMKRMYTIPGRCSVYVCVCVCVCHLPIYTGRQACGRTSRGRTGGRSHRIPHPPSLCGAVKPVFGHICTYNSSVYIKKERSGRKQASKQGLRQSSRGVTSFLLQLIFMSDVS